MRALIALFNVLFQNHQDGFLETDNFDWIPYVVSSQISLGLMEVLQIFFRTWDHAQPCAHLAQSAPTLSWGTPSIQTLRFVDEYMTLQCYSGFTSVSLRAFWQMSGYYCIRFTLAWFQSKKYRQISFLFGKCYCKGIALCLYRVKWRCILHHSISGGFYKSMQSAFVIKKGIKKKRLSTTQMQA